jgi:excisionase family DNA binding protein
MTDNESLALILEAWQDHTKRPAILRAARTEKATPKPITVREAADRLEVCTRTVQRYGSIGLLDTIRIGPRRVRFYAAQVDALATGQKAEG